MPVLKRRSRIVSFRLSDKEYETMMESCLSRGSRSLSEFARSVTYARLSGDAPIQVLKNQVEELDRMVRSLSLKVAESDGGNGKKEG
jgi:hypothetical protein